MQANYTWTVPYAIDYFKETQNTNKKVTISGLNELKFELSFEKIYHTKFNTHRDFKTLDFILNGILRGDCNKLTLDMGRIDKTALVELCKKPLDFTELYPGYEVTVIAKKNERIH